MRPTTLPRSLQMPAMSRRLPLGLMPHPEHAVEDLTGPGTDGLALFTSVLKTLVSA